MFIHVRVFHAHGGKEWYFDCASCSFRDTYRDYEFTPAQFTEFLFWAKISSLNYQIQKTAKNYNQMPNRELGNNIISRDTARKHIS